MTEEKRFERFDAIEELLLNGIYIFTQNPGLAGELDVAERLTRIYLALFDTPAFARREAKWGKEQGLVNSDSEELEDLIDETDGFENGVEDIPF